MQGNDPEVEAALDALSAAMAELGRNHLAAALAWFHHPEHTNCPGMVPALKTFIPAGDAMLAAERLRVALGREPVPQPLGAGAVDLAHMIERLRGLIGLIEARDASPRAAES